MTYYIRPMRKEDVPQVNEIDREAFPTQWPPPNYRHELDNQFAHYLVACDDTRTIDGPDDHSETGLSGLAARVKRWLNHDTVAEPLPPDKHLVVGFAGIWIMADESHLTNIAVRAAYQRQGIGELLIISVVELSAELKANLVTLEVRVSNLPAQSLYTKYSFVQTGLRRGYYTDNREDAMLMSTGNILSPEFQAQLQLLKKAHVNKMAAARQVSAERRSQPERR